MATSLKPQNGWVIYLTILIMMILMVVPLPESIRLFRPELLLMTLIYWAMALPHRMGIGTAWIVGLVMDLVLGSALGVLAFGYALAVYITARLHLQLRQFPIWQQALIIFSILFVVESLYALVSSFSLNWEVLIKSLISTVLWPLMHALLRNIRLAFQVT